MRLLPLLLAAGCGETPEPLDARPDVLLVSLDTTRADTLGVYGGSERVSPTLDRLALGGARAAEAMTVTPLTLPAHSSILTGLYPDRHGVRDNNTYRLSGAHQTLAEILGAAGWRTGAFVAAIVLDSIFGLDQGFETYADGFDLTDPDNQGAVVAHWPGEQVVGRAAAWLDDQNALSPGDPLFAWVHLYDAHQPLIPPPLFEARFPDDLYSASIAYADDQLRVLVDHWRALDRDRGLLIAVVGDHGEGNGDHGEETHGVFVYRSTMRVPLVIHGPGVPPGAVVEAPVSVTDLAPTLLDLLAVPGAADMDGRSLVPALRGQPLPERPVYGESFLGRHQFGFSELRVLQGPRSRYIRSPQAERYDWVADPGERTDLAPDGVARAEAALVSFLEGRPEDRSAMPGGHGAVDPDTLARLESLGYVGGGLGLVDPGADWRTLPDPKSQPDMVALFQTVVFAARSRPPEQGIPILETFLARYPAVGGARELLVRARQLVGDHQGAKRALGPLLQAQPDNPTLLARAGELEIALGNPEGGRALLERALVIQPGAPAPHALLAELARQSGDCQGALAIVDRGLALAPESSRLLLVRGACRQELGDQAGALADLEAVAAADPENADIHYLLGMNMARAGRLEQALTHFRLQVERTPDRALALAGLGMALYALGRYDDCLEPLALAAPDPSVGSEPPLLLADALLRSGGDTAEVERLLALALERDPESRQAHLVRAQLRMGQGDIDAALESMGSFRAQP